MDGVRTLVEAGAVFAAVRRDRGDGSRERLAGLPEREQYAAMELWRGTMTSHSVIVSRSDASQVCVKVPPSDNAGHWPAIRATSTSRDSVRPGASACLQQRVWGCLSRYHASPDLILPIDAREKDMLDAIDGRGRIATIVDRAGGARLLPRARTFFEKLLLVQSGGLRLIQRLTGDD